MWSIFSRDPIKDFPYEIGEPIINNNISSSSSADRSFWKLHKGKKKVTGQEVTIFILDFKNATVNEIEGAKTAVKKLKTLRHPSILSFYDSVESDKAIYLATESVQPLQNYLQQVKSSEADLSISWGLFQITRAVSFLINDGNLKHNSLHVGSVYVNYAGEWKLGGLEFVCGSDTTPNLSLSSHNNRLTLVPPEYQNGSKVNGSGSGSSISKWSFDSYGLGILIWEVYNGMIDETNQKQFKNGVIQKIPKSFQPIYLDLINENPSKRPNPADVIVKCRKPGGFYKNDLIDTLLFLEEIQIKEMNDKTKFFNGLVSVLDKFPPDMCRYKILPQLLNAFEFGNAGSSILAPLFKLGKLLDETEYQSKIVPCVVKLFSSTDRATRVRLLQHLEHFADHLQPSTVNEQIFGNIITGFMDTNPTVREQTVKAMLYLAPKLNHNNLNTELLKHFARLQKDIEGGIRTNTTICLGKIASHLNPQTRRRVLIPAFTRVFSDSFPQARIAGILALAATQQYHSLDDVATRILPALSGLTIDPDKTVRDNAFKTIKGFLSKLEKVSEDPALKEKLEAETNLTSLDSTVTGSWSGAGVTGVSWAVSALTSKFYKSQSTSQQSQSQQSTLIGGTIGGQSSTTTTTTGTTTTTSHSHPPHLQSKKSNSRYNSCGQQQQSSSSTTSSSIPSTPSIEHQPPIEESSTTDYDDNDWDDDNNEDWGSMDDYGDKRENEETIRSGIIRDHSSNSMNDRKQMSKTAIETEIKKNLNKGVVRERKDGWDDDDDGSWGEIEKEEETTAIISLNTLKVNNEDEDDWNNDEWFEKNPTTQEPSTSSNLTTSSTMSGNNRNDEMRKHREERKLQRQQELETKRLNKPGPLKLGLKKIAQ